MAMLLTYCSDDDDLPLHEVAVTIKGTIQLSHSKLHAELSDGMVVFR